MKSAASVMLVAATSRDISDDRSRVSGCHVSGCHILLRCNAADCSRRYLHQAGGCSISQKYSGQVMNVKISCWWLLRLLVLRQVMVRASSAITVVLASPAPRTLAMLSRGVDASMAAVVAVPTATVVDNPRKCAKGCRRPTSLPRQHPRLSPCPPHASMAAVCRFSPMALAIMICVAAILALSYHSSASLGSTTTLLGSPHNLASRRECL